MSEVTTSNWAAWVNIMPVQPTAGGTLHVTGEVDTQSTKFAYLRKTIPQGINPKILLLDLVVERGFVPAKNPQQVHYTEAQQGAGQYTSIEILYQGNRVAEILEILIVS